LIESHFLLDRVPDQSIIADGQGVKGEYMTAFRDSNNNYAMVYLPVGKEIAVNTSFINNDKIAVSWFNPGNGKKQKINSMKKEIIMSFTPPSTGFKNDWVLIIEKSNEPEPLNN
jgi:hypothetical protein